MEKLYLIIDTETANDIQDNLYYDLGYAVIDTQGVVYEQGSFVNVDIFDYPELMESAYYAEKMPLYLHGISNGEHKAKTHAQIRGIIRHIMAKYGINAVIAHNCPFDRRALNNTERYITCSKYRYFFPYGTQYIDTLALARKVMKGNDEYVTFCNENGYLTAYGKPRHTAEILYRFITKDNEFVESHTGLQDVLIEKEIFAYCVRNGAVIEL